MKEIIARKVANCLLSMDMMDSSFHYYCFLRGREVPDANKIKGGKTFRDIDMNGFISGEGCIFPRKTQGKACSKDGVAAVLSV